MTPKQLTLGLRQVDSEGIRFFIPHSGVMQAFNLVNKRYLELREHSSEFVLIVLVGPKGCGKTHLLNSILEAENSKYDLTVSRFDWSGKNILDNDIVRFVDNYESTKREGGMIAVEMREHPQSIVDNPHLSSRLLAADLANLDYPREDELEPVLNSLLARRNLLFSQATLQYLLKRLPREPLSFERIFAKIDELSLPEHRPVKRTLIRQALSSKSKP